MVDQPAGPALLDDRDLVPIEPARSIHSAIDVRTLDDMDEGAAAPADVKRIQDRILDQAHDHWHEFSVIVASANIVLALLLAGRIVTAGRGGQVALLAIVIAAAATTAAVLAYYSIQVGALFIFGPLRLADVVLSFCIAATQVALFIWPTHVLNAARATNLEAFRNLRHWLIFYGAFGLVAMLANRHAARRRRRRHLAGISDRYEKRQRSDAVSASASSAVVLACWALSWRWLPVPTFIGAFVAVGGSAVGVVSQARTVRRLAGLDSAAPAPGNDR